MIIIFCDSFEDAQFAYEAFIDFLEEYEPYRIKKAYDAAYCVETDDDLRFIFVDYRFKPLFHTFCRPDEISDIDFFKDIDKYYFGN